MGYYDIAWLLLTKRHGRLFFKFENFLFLASGMYNIEASTIPSRIFTSKKYLTIALQSLGLITTGLGMQSTPKATTHK